jgi:hypothetical protein
MGREARCRATLDGAAGDVKVHLDTATLQVRGAFRLEVPFAEMRDVRERDGALHFRSPAGEVTLALGAAEAPKWAKAIREPKSLLDKLGLKAGTRVCLRGNLDQTFARDLAARLGAAPAATLRGRFDAIVAQFETPADLASLDALRAHLEPDGMLWLIAPKGKSSPLPEALLREAFLAAGLVDVKVAAYSPTHTAVKVVIPRAARAVRSQAIGQ